MVSIQHCSASRACQAPKEEGAGAPLGKKLKPEGGWQPSHSQSSCPSVRFREHSPCGLSFSMTQECKALPPTLSFAGVNCKLSLAISSSSSSLSGHWEGIWEEDQQPRWKPNTCSSAVVTPTTKEPPVAAGHPSGAYLTGGQRSLTQPHKSLTAPSQAAPFPRGMELCYMGVQETPPCGTATHHPLGPRTY